MKKSVHLTLRYFNFREAEQYFSQEQSPLTQLYISLSRIVKKYANILDEYDTWLQVFDQTFEASATDVSCLIERVADTLIKQLPREKAQVSSDYSTAVEF